MKESKLYYFVVYFLPLAMLFFVLMTTDFYLPESKKIENENELAIAIANEVMKLASNKDTLYLIVDNYRLAECGNEAYESSRFTRKIQEIKNAFRNRYYFDKKNTFQQFYIENDKIISTGINSSNPDEPYNFLSPLVYFDTEKIKKKNVYVVQYNSISEDEVDISIINYSNNQEVQSFTLDLKDNNWILE